MRDVCGLPAGCRLVVGLTAAAALVLLVLSAVHVRPDRGSLLLALLLLGCAGVTGLAGRFGEPQVDPVVDPRVLRIVIDGCWQIPAIVLLPRPLVVPVAVVMYVCVDALQFGASTSVKAVHNAASVGVAAAAAAAVGEVLLPDAHTGRLLTSGPSVAFGLLCVVVVFAGCGHLLVGLAIRLAEPGATWRQAVGDGPAAALELALLCLGAIAAPLLAVDLAFAVLLPPVQLTLQRLSWLGVLRLQVDRDVKTRLLNARAWTEIAGRLAARAQVQGEPLAVLLVDLDRFKSVNDRHGHLAGDCVLQAAADVLRQTLRPMSVAARFGGEEFVVLLPGTPPQAAAVAAERLRAALEGLPIRLAGGDVVRITASIGVSAPLAEDGLAGLLASADGAMYRAKDAGRNRVCVGGPGQQPVSGPC